MCNVRLSRCTSGGCRGRKASRRSRRGKCGAAQALPAAGDRAGPAWSGPVGRRAGPGVSRTRVSAGLAGQGVGGASARPFSTAGAKSPPWPPRRRGSAGREASGSRFPRPFPVRKLEPDTLPAPVSRRFASTPRSPHRASLRPKGPETFRRAVNDVVFMIQHEKTAMQGTAIMVTVSAGSESSGNAGVRGSAWSAETADGLYSLRTWVVSSRSFGTAKRSYRECDCFVAHPLVRVPSSGSPPATALDTIKA